MTAPATSGARSARSGRLPGSDELFRRTTGAVAGPDSPVTAVVEPHLRAASSDTPVTVVTDVTDTRLADGETGERRASERRRHDEKITVYLTAEELLDLEQARLALKRDFGIRADRGRIVRAALAEALTELDHEAADCALVRRLDEA